MDHRPQYESHGRDEDLSDSFGSAAIGPSECKDMYDSLDYSTILLPIMICDLDLK